LTGAYVAGPLFADPIPRAAVLLAVSVALYAWLLAWAWAFSLRKYSLHLAAWGFVRPLPATYWLVPLVFALSIYVRVVHAGLTDPPSLPLPPWLTETRAGIALMLVTACLLAPLAEEVFFRGFVFTGLAGSTGWLWAAIISSALFAASHMQIHSVVPFFAQGLLLCWVRRSGGSLWGAVAVHAAMNLLVVGVRVGT